MKVLHALVTLVLSVFAPGLGPLYAGRLGQGLAIFASVILGFALLFGARFTLYPPTPALAYATMVPALVAVLWWFAGSLVAVLVTLTAGRIPGRGGLRTLLGICMVIGTFTGLAEIGKLNSPRPNWHPLRIDGSSMQPSLRPGDSAVSWTGYYASAEPEPGDVVTATNPSNAIPTIWRIIAGPGVRVQFLQGRMRINGDDVQRVPAVDPPSSDPALISGHRFVEILPNGRHYEVLQADSDSVWPDTPEFQVPEGHYMVLSDNRLTPHRAGQLPAMVPRTALQDRVMFVWWSRSLARLGSTVFEGGKP